MLKLKHSLQFALQFLKRPREMGSIWPSSEKLAWEVRQVIQQLPRHKEFRLIELGPGTGVLTQELKTLGLPLTLIEKNSDFAKELRMKFPEQRILCEDVLETSVFNEKSQPTILISSLPVLSLPSREDLRGFFGELLKHGKIDWLIQYSYSPADPLSLDEFGIQGLRKKVVWFNIPPASIWTYRGK